MKEAYPIDKEVFEIFEPYHNKIKLEKIVGKYKPVLPPEAKVDDNRLANGHVRKQNFKTFNLMSNQYTTRENPLNPEFQNILELSTRAPFCPQPLVLDTMMGVCSYNCRYCFSALTVSSLMGSFFDGNVLEPRYANPIRTRDTLLSYINARGVEPVSRDRKSGDTCGSVSDPMSVKKAFAQRMAVRFGTRSENFLPMERQVGVAYEALKVFKDTGYPLIINTKSSIPIEDKYFKVISEMDNVAIQVTICHTNDHYSKVLEPGAPRASKRIKVLETFNKAGIKAMPRCEPCMAFFNDSCEHLDDYFGKMKDAGCKDFLGDPFHHTVHAEEIIKTFYSIGIDFDRMWEATTEYQWLGSYVMEHFFHHAKKFGLKCGSFNYHSVPYNDHIVCCGTDDIFPNWNKYSMIPLLNELIKNKKLSFEDFDNKYWGYELHPGFRERVKRAWNMSKLSWDNPDFMEGAYVIDDNDPNNYVWGFDHNRLGRNYENIVKIFGDKMGTKLDIPKRSNIGQDMFMAPRTGCGGNCGACGGC